MHRRPLLRALAGVLALAAGILSAAAIALAEGEPDPDFGDSGAVGVALGDFRGLSRPVVDRTPDGGVVAAVVSRGDGGCGPSCVGRRGDAPDRLDLVRLTATGGPYAGTDDDGWSEEGTGFVEGIGGMGTVMAVRVLGDGTILVAISDGDLVLVRVNPDGTPDDGFAPNGTVSSDSACTEGGQLERVFISEDGARVDAVWSCSGSAVVESLDGDLDALDETTVSHPDGFYLRDAAKDADGRIVLLGWNLGPDEDEDHILLRRVGADGTIDESFDVYVPGNGLTISVDPENRPVVSLATHDNRWDFRRFTEAGEIDTSFGVDEGVASVSHEQLEQRGSSTADNTPFLAHQWDGRLVAVGGTEPFGGVAVVRLTPEGERDSEFDEDGVLILEGVDRRDIDDVGPPLLEPDGKIFIPGASWSTSGTERAIGPTEAGLHVFALLYTGPPPEVPTTDTTPPPTTTTTTTPTTPPQTVPVPPPGPGPLMARTCRSRRSFVIRVRPRSRRLRSARVVVAGRRVKVRRRGTRLVATVNLRRLKQATFTVSITARDARGRRYRDKRRYRTCRVGEYGRKVKGGSIVVTLRP